MKLLSSNDNQLGMLLNKAMGTLIKLQVANKYIYLKWFLHVTVYSSTIPFCFCICQFHCTMMVVIFFCMQLLAIAIYFDFDFNLQAIFGIVYCNTHSIAIQIKNILIMLKYYVNLVFISIQLFSYTCNSQLVTCTNIQLSYYCGWCTGLGHDAYSTACSYQETFRMGEEPIVKCH